MDLGPCLDAERYDKSKTNLEGNVIGSGSTLVPVQTLVRPFRACTQVWTGTCVDTSPCTPLSVSLVYVFDASDHVHNNVVNAIVLIKETQRR